MVKQINGKVRADVGAFASLIGCLFANKLPKTRSGKILRGTIRKITNAQEYAYPATIDDPTALDEITELVNKWKGSLNLWKSAIEL
jgi:propionyl-CoA synthetase